MTVDERVRLAVGGLRLRTDELGRPPSHDEVEAVLRKTLGEAEAEAEQLREALRSIDELCLKYSVGVAIRAAVADELEECCKVICGRCARGWPLIDKVTHEHPTEPKNENVVLVCFAAELREQRSQARGA